MSDFQEIPCPNASIKPESVQNDGSRPATYSDAMALEVGCPDTCEICGGDGTIMTKRKTKPADCEKCKGMGNAAMARGVYVSAPCGECGTLGDAREIAKMNAGRVQLPEIRLTGLVTVKVSSETHAMLPLDDRSIMSFSSQIELERFIANATLEEHGRCRDGVCKARKWAIDRLNACEVFESDLGVSKPNDHEHCAK